MGRGAKGAALETREQQQLYVDRASRIAPGLDERRNILAGDEVDRDVLVLVSAPVADFAHAMSAHEREAFRDHSRRAVELAQPLDPLGGEAGFLLKLADRGPLDGRVLVFGLDGLISTLLARLLAGCRMTSTIASATSSALSFQSSSAVTSWPANSVATEPGMMTVTRMLS